MSFERDARLYADEFLSDSTDTGNGQQAGIPLVPSLPRSFLS